MSLSIAISMTAQMISFVMALLAFEIILLTRKRALFEIWSYQNIKSDLEQGLPLPHSWIQTLFSSKGFKALIFLQIVMAIAGIFILHPLIFIILFLVHLLICIRFRGTFNGGSDMMIFVILTGIIISLSRDNETVKKLGLIYISIHTVYSYFKAGLVKIIHKDWRTGLSLPAFLERSQYFDIKPIAELLKQKPILCFLLGWSVLIFELAIIILPWAPSFVFPYFIAAAVFHFANYLSFGLNRFFWAWLAAWPSVLYVLSL